MIRTWILLPLALITACIGQTGTKTQDPEIVRFAEFNVEDIRTADLSNPDHPRLKQAAAILQTIRPDIVLLSEVAFDYAGVAGYDSTVGEGANGGRFVANFLAIAQNSSTMPIDFQYFSAPTNTGVSSGFDLDNSGSAVREYPSVQLSNPAGDAPRQTAAERSYGNDSWGFGVFPGQYGMLLLVNPDIEILRDKVRTFQLFKWSDMPGALVPQDSAGTVWYDDAEWRELRLSSKSHWDVPVRLRNGAVVHLLLSHPTPPAFDGPEGRNKRRNHDEVRFWGDYISGADYIVDDQGKRGGLSPGVHFVVMGDLNADIDEGSSFGNPVGEYLLSNPAVNGTFVPVADSSGQALYGRLDADDTAQWGLRVDYVLPSSTMKVHDGGLYRPAGFIVSDHFPVWLDAEVPAPSR